MAEKYLGESIGKLGFGFMRLPKIGEDFDYATINEMVDAFLGAGFTYFDTAYMYKGSEEAMCQTLVSRYPRESFQIATKLNLMLTDKPEDMMKCFETSLKRLGTDYIDFYMLHDLSGAMIQKAEDFGAWELLKKLKAAGRIKHYGLSYHDTPEKLDGILTRHPDAEFVQLQINYLDWDSEDVFSRGVYEVAGKHNKPVTIMEPIKGGHLSSDDSAIYDLLKKADPAASLASWAIRFAASLGGIVTVLSGMNTMEQLSDNIKTIKNLKPFSDGEREVLREAVGILHGIPRVPCTGCKYCVENCPQNINIPDLLDLYNDYLVYNTIVNTEFPFFLATKDGGLPSSCVVCRSCEEHCPQHIAISDHMGKMAALYE